MTVRPVPGRTPKIHPGAWVDPAALVIGDVELAEGASIWRRMNEDELDDIRRNAREYLGLWQREHRGA